MVQRTWFKSFLGVLLVLSFLTFFGCQEEKATQKAAPAAAKTEAPAVAVPNRIDMSIPQQISLRVSYDDPTLWPAKENVPDPEHAFAVLFKDYVERSSAGKIKVELFGSGALGSYRQTLEMVQNGSLDINIGTGSLANFFKEIQLLAIPYVFMSDDVVQEFFNGSSLWRELMEKMEKDTGMKYLAIGQNGWRNFTNNARVIRKPDDLKGLKFRVMESPVYIKFIESMGGRAVPIAWNEVYTALQTGVVDGHENPISPIYLGKIYEVQKYLTMDGHIWSENIMVMNSAKFKSLPVAAQQIILQGAKLGAQANDVAERMVSNIVKYEIVAKRMQVYFPTQEEKDAFKKVSQPAVVEYLQGQLGKELVDRFLKEVDLAEQRAGWRK
ncbi:MAG: DctP family TRAP transporter solute-binding subunit [Spirochaetales bacterium]